MPTGQLGQETDPIYRLPPYEYTTRTLDSHELAEQIDWGLKNENLETVWKTTQGYSQRLKKAVKAAVLDTGVDPDHQDIKPVLKDLKDFTNSPISGPTDRNDHGTHCCGILAAAANGIGIIGVAPKIELRSYKVLGDDGSGSSSGIAKGIMAAVADGNHVLSMSLGSPVRSTAIMDAIKYAVEAGCIVVCAAGNEGVANSVNWPGKAENVICVASYNKAGKISSFSSQGNEVDVAAPGENVLSCIPDNKYVGMSGTSMATPFVAGACCLAIACEWDVEKPKVPIFVEGDKSNNYSRMLSLLSHNAKDYGPVGQDPHSGWGFINVKEVIGGIIGGSAVGNEIAWGPVVLNGVSGSWVFRPNQ